MSREFPEPGDDPAVLLEETDMPLPDSVVNKSLRYTGFKKIATGGKCVIQSCHDGHLRRTIAMKMLRKECAKDPIEQKRFLREARVSAMLQHPNTIPVYELSRNQHGQMYFTMKLLQGATLREVIDESRESEFYYIEGYGLDRMVSILIQVGHALDYAHAHRVIHRDVKPANILMGSFGEVVLLDWGLAKVWNEGEADAEIEEEEPGHALALATDDTSLTGQGQLQGTAPYMSPEQIEKSRAIDPRTDVYSLGAVLYEALTLETMIQGESFQMICDNARHQMPPSPSQRAPDRNIPADLESICMKAVQKKPEERFATMHKFVTELRAWRSRRVRQLR